MNGALQAEDDDALDRRFGPGPFGELLGFRLVHADEEGATVEATPGPEHANGGGIVHGGYLGALLDITTGWAVESQLPVGVGAPLIQNGDPVRASRSSGGTADLQSAVHQGGAVGRLSRSRDHPML
jgi:acyl-coenzyme A thioesterase PaaI-like protein